MPNDSSFRTNLDLPVEDIFIMTFNCDYVWQVENLWEVKEFRLPCWSPWVLAFLDLWHPYYLPSRLYTPPSLQSWGGVSGFQTAPRTTESLPTVSPPRAWREPHTGAVDLSASVLPNPLHHFRLVSAISPGLQHFTTSHPEKSLLHLPCPSFHVEMPE